TGGRLQIGMVGEIISESWATSIGIRSEAETAPARRGLGVWAGAAAPARRRAGETQKPNPSQLFLPSVVPELLLMVAIEQAGGDGEGKQKKV
ncbi:hypothetical protein ACFPGQ_42680, partial [Bradyrhizobium sp. GCM10023181]|nr:hypothetical protein [Bradyrhizobium zhengyangense]